MIIERASLLYYEQPENEIKRDEEWIKNLKVREIDYIEGSYTLGNINKIKKNNTSIIQEMNTLYITSESTFLDISRHIVNNTYKSFKWDKVFRLNTLLTTPLLDLKVLGYPVNRILDQYKNKIDKGQ